jgi:P4 family phage/plasmid primase-like protien
VFLGDPDADQKVQVLQEIAGAAATGYGTQLRDPKAVILKGETAENGKSQILDLYRSLLPPEAVASIPAAKMDERYLPQLAGKYLNAADELSGSAAIASDTFKSTVTGEPVTGREVYRTAFTFRPIAQHVFCTNALPSFSGGIDRGVSRRLLVITFNRVIPKEERVEHIGLRIGEEETDLLLAWAVDGASRLIRQRDFTIPPSSKEALHDWLHSADPVIAWAQECVTAVDPLTAGWAETKIKRAVAHKVFTTWSESEGFPANKLPLLTASCRGWWQITQRSNLRTYAPGTGLLDLKSRVPALTVLSDWRRCLRSGELDAGSMNNLARYAQPLAHWEPTIRSSRTCPTPEL